MNKILINIDYLILNLEGQIFGDCLESSDFKINWFDYGTSIFKRRGEVHYKNEKIGILTSEPRSKILNENFAQIQLENHLYYTKSHNELQKIIELFLDETNYHFKGINRLDICVDKNDDINMYRDLHSNILNGLFLLSGRPKNIQSYYETFKGKSVLNGFQIGKRTSSKLVRVYNKTLSLQLTEKPYINEWHKKNGLQTENIWRLEFQLNSTFFTDLNKHSSHDKNVKEKITWNLFQIQTLFELFKIAKNGFFDIHYNTGKSQINKEQQFNFLDVNEIQQTYTTAKSIVLKTKNVAISSTTIKKRLAKSLFREYYSNHQDLSYVIALNMILEDIDVLTDKPLFNWFNGKIKHYLFEFQNKDKIRRPFNKSLFNEHQQIFL